MRLLFCWAWLRTGIDKVRGRRLLSAGVRKESSLSVRVRAGRLMHGEHAGRMWGIRRHLHRLRARARKVQLSILSSQ